MPLKLPKVLRAAIDQAGYTVAEFAERLGIKPPQLRHYLSDTHPGKYRLTSFLDLLPQETHGSILAAWIYDDMPEKYAQEVAIFPIDQHDLDFLISEHPQAEAQRQRIRSQLDTETKRAFMALVIDSIQNRHTRSAIQSAANRLRNIA